MLRSSHRRTTRFGLSLFILAAMLPALSPRTLAAARARRPSATTATATTSTTTQSSVLAGLTTVTTTPATSATVVLVPSAAVETTVVKTVEPPTPVFTPPAAPIPTVGQMPTSPSLPLVYVKKATWDETLAASLAASSVTAPVLGDWHYIGPFDNSRGEGFDAVYPPEKQIALDASYEGKGDRSVRWKRGDYFSDGRVNDLKPFFDDKQNVVAYLYRTILCPADVERVASFGSDDTITVWVNGMKVLAKNVARGAAPDQDRVTLKLRQGQNDLLLKICQGGGDWAFCFAMDSTVPPSIEAALLRRLIVDFPADSRVDAAYQRLFDLRRAVSRDLETPALDLLGFNVKDFGASGIGAATNGNIDAGARLVTNVADTSTFRPGQGIYLWHFKPTDGLAVVDAGKGDYVASVRFRPQPGGNPSEAGLAFRATDAKNYWALSATFASATAPSAKVRLLQVRDGSPTELRAKDIARPSSPTAALALKVVLTGDRIQALVNDRALFDLTDRFGAGERKVGLYHNAGHRAGSPVFLDFRVDSQIADDFDRPNNRYDLGAAPGGQKWQALAGRWGIVDRAARRTEGATGEKLASVVVAVRPREIELAHAWAGEDNALVEVAHDDTRAIERALGVRLPGDFGLFRHVIFPDGGYNISRPLRLGPYVKLTGLNPGGAVGPTISALPGFAPEFDDEKFLIHWICPTARAADNRQQSLENLRLNAMYPETNPGLSGVQLATGPGCRYIALEVEVPRRGIVVGEGSADSLFETIEVRAGEACFDLLGRETHSLVFRNLTLGLYDLGKTATGLRIRPGVAGLIVEGMSCSGPSRPVLIQGGADITLLGLNVTGSPDYPVVEAERAPDDLALMVSGVARGASKAVVIAGETVAWVRRPGESSVGPQPFRFTGGQSSFWMGAASGDGQVNFADLVRPAQEIKGGESYVADLIDTRARGGGSAVYEYVTSTGGAGATVEVGSLTLLHNFQDFQVLRTVKGRVGPDAGQSLFTPDAQMRDGLLTLRIKADVARDHSIWFNAVKTGLGLPGPGPSEVRPSSATAELAPRSATRPGADGYVRDWLVAGPVDAQGDTLKNVLDRDDLRIGDLEKVMTGQTVVVRGESLRWVVAHSDEPQLDLNRLFSPTEWRPVENAFGYIVAHLISDREISGLTLRLDFDDGVRLWLNGREVKYDRDGLAPGGNGNPAYRLFDPEVGEKVLAYHGVATGLTLRKGENVVVMKVCNAQGPWRVGLRFKTADGQPLRDFRVATSPE